LRGFLKEAGSARFLFMGAMPLESIVKSDLESKILGLSVQHLEPKGFRLVDVDCRIGGRSLVRLFIEKLPHLPPSIDECAEVSRSFGTLLDTENVIPTAYDLEVSSPGLDRRLRLRSDFEESVGREVKLKLTETVTGLGANVTGKLERVQDEGIIVFSQKKEWPIPLGKIKQANVVWQFDSRV
jgi:ribosome maturation factor RimP